MHVLGKYNKTGVTLRIFLNHLLFILFIQMGLDSGSGLRKAGQSCVADTCVGYRVSQRRESDTRPVCGDNEEAAAQPQSHMKGIFGD